MKRIYEVAGHKFSVAMPDNHFAWDEMKQYDPFLTDKEDDCVFTAEMIDQLPELPGKHLVNIAAEGPGLPRHELYEYDNGWLMATAPDVEAPVRVYVLMDRDFTKMQFRILGSVRFSINTALMLMFAFSTATMDTLLVHASVTIKDGKGYLFLGKSGTGKSTHSQLWINNIEGCELLNDDNPILRFDDAGLLRVYGSPWSGKTPCYRNLDVPVGAVVDLHQAKKNAIRRLPLAEAYAIIYVSLSGYRAIRKMADGQHRTNERIALNVPCYSLECLPNAEAAWLCYKTVAL